MQESDMQEAGPLASYKASNLHSLSRAKDILCMWVCVCCVVW